MPAGTRGTFIDSQGCGPVHTAVVKFIGPTNRKPLQMIAGSTLLLTKADGANQHLAASFSSQHAYSLA